MCSSDLVHDVRKRPNCCEALSNEWFQIDSAGSRTNGGSNRDGSEGQIVSSIVMDRVQAIIQLFAGYSKLKKLALYVIAHKSSVDEIGFLQQLFQNRFDIEKDGVITLDEFKKALEVYSYTYDEVTVMFNAIDIDGCGDISYTEFLAATIEAHGSIEEDRIAEAFDRLDSDDDGYITVRNLKEFLGQEISIDYIDSIIEEVDESKDHRIDYDEFLNLWNENFDEDLASALRDVKRKRLVRESITELPQYDVGEHGEFLDDEGENENESLASHPPGAGNYYFAQEKEKSMRGVWI